MKISKFFFIGNYLCLDFLNTEIVERGKSVDLLTKFTDLADWLFEAEVVDAEMKEEITGKWRESAGSGGLAQPRKFRAVLHHIVENIVHGKPVERSGTEAINRILHKQNEYLYLHTENGKHSLKSQLLFEQPVHLLTPIAKSAANLLAHADFSLIKKCANPVCPLYYYDISKNRKRRWCSMKTCGNRLKAAAHYERKKQKVP